LRLVRFLGLAGFALALPAWAQTIRTVAGGGPNPFTEGAAATSVGLGSPLFVKADSAGNFYIWDGAAAIRKVSSAGTITTYAGNGRAGYSGDGGAATSAMIFANGTVHGLAVDNSGNVYFSDGQNQRVRKVSASGIVTTVAGNGTAGFSGDGGEATSAMVNYPNGLAVDSFGNLYIADRFNERVRKVDTTGKISTVAGDGNSGFGGDGGQATAATIGDCIGVAVDGSGNLYISGNFRIRKVDTAGVISTVTGTGSLGYSGDGGAAAGAAGDPIGIAVDAAGNLYFADANAQRVRKIDTSGKLTTVAGNGKYADSGDGGPAIGASMKTPVDVSFDGAGNLYIAETSSYIRKVSGAAGTGTAIQASPAALTFSYTAGGAAPANQNLNVSSSGAALSFSAAATTTSGSGWLSVTPAGGSTPATLAVSVTPAGLGSGTYNGAITITPGGAGNGPQSIAVTLNVSGAGAPVFTGSAVVNASGYQNVLAPGAVFVIFGSGMGPATLAAATGPGYPNSVGGTSIAFTPATGGPPIATRMVYSVATQVAGVLPSSIAPGAYGVVVTYNGIASGSQRVTVVARSLGIATANSSGAGVAQATIGTVNGGLSLTRFTTGSLAFGGYTWTLTPAHPGDTLVLWGTGGGADPANDAGGSSGDQTQAGNFTVTVDGRAITPLYAGASSGYPGLWQINFTLPADMAPDCFANVQVSAGSSLSNTVVVPIADSGQGACTDPQLSAASLAKLDAGGDIVLASFALSEVSSTTTTAAGSVTTGTAETAFGGVSTLSAAEVAAARGQAVNGCTVSNRTAAVTVPVASAPDAYLNAGSPVTVGGPNLSPPLAMAPQAIQGLNGVLYYMTIPNGTLTGGTYTLTGNGSSAIGPFSASLSFPASFAVVNFAGINTINRTQPLTLNWTGGGSGYVSIVVSTQAPVSGTPANAATYVVHTVGLQCSVPASQGTFTIPVSLTSLLLPATPDATSGTLAILQVEAVSAPTPNFTATLSTGGSIDAGYWSYALGVSKNLVIQ
jgi:uncharacterized protein (TIGR03437 family)